MPMSFDVLDGTLVFSDEEEKYNSYRLLYSELAEERARHYMKSCYHRYSGIDEFDRSGRPDGYKIIAEAMKGAVDELIKSGIYDVDLDVFIERYGLACFAPWEEACEDIHEKYMEIVATAEQLDEYRTARRQNRARFIGGGFGLQGAAKGALTAGGLNLASGAIHGAFNLVGKAISAIGDGIKKSNLYHSEDTQGKLRQGMHDTVFRIHYALCDVLGISSGDSDAKKRADAVFNNIGKIPENDRLPQLREILRINPYKFECYSYCLDEFGDRSGQLTALAMHFGVGLDDYKLEKIDDVFSSLQMSDEEEALGAWQAVLDAMSFYGVETSQALVKIEAELRAFDEQARTVDGVLLDSRDEAANAKADLEVIAGILNSGEYRKSELHALDAMRQLRHQTFKTQIASKYIASVEAVVAEFDKQARTVGGTVFDSRQEADYVREDLATIGRILNLDECKRSDQAALATLEALRSQTFRTNIANPYLVAVEELVRKHDEWARTVNGTLMGTREEADNARRDLDVASRIVDIEACRSSEAVALVTLDQLKRQEFATDAARGYIDELSSIVREFDENARTFDGVVYRSREEAATAKIQIKTVKEIMERNDLNTYKGASAAVEQLTNG